MSLRIFTHKQSFEERTFIHCLVFPSLMTFAMFAIRLIESVNHTHYYQLGIFPLEISSLTGILTAPLIHGDWHHFFNNAWSFFTLSLALLYFYRGIAYRAFAFIYLFSGVFVWLAGRYSWHIGSSGVIYGLASFLFVSGIIRRYIPLLAISLVVVFLYGSMIWGIFPFQFDLPYSWEAHLGGTISGITLAILLRNKGPQKKVKVWDNDEDDIDQDEFWNAK